VSPAPATMAVGSRTGAAPTGWSLCPVCGVPIPSSAAAGPCFCCRTVARQLRVPLVPLVSVVTAARRGASARRLRAYKDSPVAEHRSEVAAALVDLVRRWLAAGGRVPPGTVVTVPSTSRPAPPPVDRLVAAVPELADRWAPGALMAGPGRSDHLLACRDGFRIRPGRVELLRARRAGTAVVVDDTYTTGARAQSAAATLRLAGIRVSGILVVGHLCGGGPVH
jgi:hypothetical protein